jgi:hypothetical protein
MDHTSHPTNAFRNCENEMANINEEQSERLIEEVEDEGHVNYQSLDYDICYNEPYMELLEGYSKPRRCLGLSRPDTYYHGVMEWILVFAIGAGTGMVCLNSSTT